MEFCMFMSRCTLVILNKMRQALWLCLLCGCSSQQVFLSRAQVIPAKINALQQQLQQQGYDVTVINVAPPYKLTQPLLIKSPLLFDDAYINGIVRAIQQQGYATVDVISMQTAQHFYNGYNVGLYLPSSFSINMPVVMQTDNCAGQYMVLQTDADTHNFTLDRGDEYPLLKGNYSLNAQGNGTLSTQNTQMLFKLVRVPVSTWAGERQADKLTVTAQTSSLLPEHCSFITIYDGSPP
jgi:hypothetical protein